MPDENNPNPHAPAELVLPPPLSPIQENNGLNDISDDEIEVDAPPPVPGAPPPGENLQQVRVYKQCTTVLTFYDLNNGVVVGSKSETTNETLERTVTREVMDTELRVTFVYWT